MRDLSCLLNYALINIRTENLDPEHLSKSFYKGPCPLDETFKNNFMGTSSDKNQSCSLPATSFSLKLARNQSAVCLITVKIEIASSLM